MIGDFAAAVVLALAAIQASETDSGRQLRDIQQQLATAWVAGDDARTHRIIAITVDDVRVKVFGDAAVVTGRTHGRGESGKTPYDVVIRFTDTFVRREGQWQAVASHASLLPTR